MRFRFVKKFMTLDDLERTLFQNACVLEPATKKKITHVISEENVGISRTFYRNNTARASMHVRTHLSETVTMAAFICSLGIRCNSIRRGNWKSWTSKGAEKSVYRCSSVQFPNV